jgi:hypothetical protein
LTVACNRREENPARKTLEVVMMARASVEKKGEVIAAPEMAGEIV